METPTYNIEKSLLDWIIEIVSLTLITVGIILSAIFYTDLPETIPTHFNINGEPDSFGNKTNILFLIGTWLITYIALALSPRWPNLINYPFTLKPETEKQHYQNAFLMIRTLNLVSTLLIGSIIYGTFQNALGHADGLGVYSVISLGLVFISLAIFVLRGWFINQSN